MENLFDRANVRIAQDSRGHRVVLEPKMNHAQHILADCRQDEEVTELQLGVE